MRIAMLGHKRMPSREGGIEVVVEELSVRMAALGHEVTVYSRTGHNVAGAEFDMKRADEYRGVRIKEVPTLDIRGFAALTSSYSATKAAIADRPDVIHFHAEGPSAMIGMAKRAGIRSVATIHGLDWQRAKWGPIASRYIRHGERVAARQADALIVLSENLQGYFLREYGRQTELIPNGVEPRERVKAGAASAALGLDGGPYVLYLGRIVPEKCVHLLIEAFTQLDGQARLVIAGGPSDSRSYYDRLHSMAAADPRIVFAGFVQGRLLEELYSNAAVYVLPSELEGMPMSLLEAMSYGCCCLTSDIPECTEVLGGCGESFTCGDAGELAGKLELLLGDAELRESLGSAAGQRVRESYGWDEAVRRTLELYQGA